MSEVVKEDDPAVFSVEEIRGLLQKSEGGIPRQTISNCRSVLMLDPMLKDRIRRNNLSGMTDLVGEVPWKRAGIPTMTDTDLHEIECYLETKYDLRSEKAVQKAIDIIANDHQYNPILEHLESLAWDGQPRIRTLLPIFLGAEENDYTEQVTLLLMRAALKRLYEPGCKFDSMICLVGDQGAGKSTFFRFLALRDEWFSDDLKRLEDENIYRKLQGHWIIEMSEMLATANARSIEDTKAFLSRQKDTYKIPYDRFPRDFPRQCIFVGTTNSLQFLPFDRSGNRRFIPLRINSEKAQINLLADEVSSRAYLEQAWAEMMEIFKNEETHPLTLPDDMQDYLKTLQKEYMPEDARDGILLSWLEDQSPDYVCSLMIWRDAFGEQGRPKAWDVREINEMMNRLTDWTPVSSHRFAVYGTQRAWKNPKDGFVHIPDAMLKEMPFNLS
jgi:predicted P-loop ATPase